MGPGKGKKNEKLVGETVRKDLRELTKRGLPKEGGTLENGGTNKEGELATKVIQGKFKTRSQIMARGTKRSGGR